jgi:hypothetical protein
MTVNLMKQVCSARCFDLAVELVANPAHLFDRRLLLLLYFTHHRSPPEDFEFQGPDTPASSLPR